MDLNNFDMKKIEIKNYKPRKLTNEEKNIVMEEAEKFTKELDQIKDEYINGDGSSTYRLFRIIGYLGFGITIFYDPLNPYSIPNAVFGIFIMIIIGFINSFILKLLLTSFNNKLKKKVGRKAINYAVSRGLVYVLPFSIMSLVATFLLNWSIVTILLSTAIMSAGTSANSEISRLSGKSLIRNTILTSAVSYVITYSIAFSFSYLVKGAGILEGVYKLLPILLGNGGGI